MCTGKEQKIKSPHTAIKTGNSNCIDRDKQEIGDAKEARKEVVRTASKRRRMTKKTNSCVGHQVPAT